MASPREAAIDDMIEFAMEELLSGNTLRKQAMVRRMAERWPTEPALALVYAVTSATESIEDSFGGAAANDPVIPLGYRLSALISADVHAVQSMGALLHKSGDRRGSPVPGQTYPTASVTGMPSAVKPFRTATRTWNSAI